MKVLLLVCFLGLVLARPEDLNFESKLAYNGYTYHELVGIPEASRIKAAEEAIDFSGSRIVGGSPSYLGRHPWMGGVLITLSSGATSVCGSCLLSNTRALTAAHCWGSQASFLTLAFGTVQLFGNSGTRVTSNDVVSHASYSPTTLINNIAMIRLPHINYTNHIRNIQIATGTATFVNLWAWMAGYGRNSDIGGIDNNQVLHHVELQVIANNVCQAIYGTTIVPATILCTSSVNGRSPCGGDAGGPLSVWQNNDDVLIGTYSFHHVEGCQRGHPAGFTRITSFTAWINTNLA